MARHEIPSHPRRSARRRATVLLGVLVAALVLASVPARADDEEYDPRRAGHPLRIVAYILHPIGVAIDYLILRPAWWIGSHEPIRTIVGRTD